MLKKIIDIFGNSILFYADKEGNAVFRNYRFFKNTGWAYKLELSKPEVGKILEYRFDLDKFLKRSVIILTILIYFLFIHTKATIWNFLWCFILWVSIIWGIRHILSKRYSNLLIKTYGEYDITEFKPNIEPEKQKLFIQNACSKIVITLALIIIFAIPAFIMQFALKTTLNKQEPHLKLATGISKIYSIFYPKTQDFYDMQAYISYLNKDYKTALKNYKAVLETSGKKFSQKDYTRFANMLYIEKKIHSPALALDSFNDYATRKKMSVLDESKMLWIKSIFSIENHIEDMVIADYNDLLLSIGEKDKRNLFYVTSDKAYMLYLTNEYEEAIKEYDSIIPYAIENEKSLKHELKRLYAERGFAKYKIGNTKGAQEDFIKSGISADEINSYQPSFLPQDFIIEKF